MLWQAIPSSGDYSSNERRIEGRLLQCSPGGCAILRQSFGLNLLIVLLWPEIKGDFNWLPIYFIAHCLFSHLNANKRSHDSMDSWEAKTKRSLEPSKPFWDYSMCNNYKNSNSGTPAWDLNNFLTSD